MLILARLTQGTESKKDAGLYVSAKSLTFSKREGEPITEFKPLKDEVQGATDKLWDDLTELADKYGFEVIIGDARGTDGYCTHEKKEIVIDENAEFGYRLKTLIHEMAHMILHADINQSYQLNRARYETEAEGVAYVVASSGHHSETDAYNFGYIATWGKDDTKKLVGKA